MLALRDIINYIRGDDELGYVLGINTSYWAKSFWWNSCTPGSGCESVSLLHKIIDEVAYCGMVSVGLIDGQAQKQE